MLRGLGPGMRAWQPLPGRTASAPLSKLVLLVVLLLCCYLDLSQAFIRLPSVPARARHPRTAWRPRECGVVLRADPSPSPEDETRSGQAEGSAGLPPSPPAVGKAGSEADGRGSSEGLGEYLFGRPGELEADLRALGISRRRLLLNTLLAAVLALGADFLGVTRLLLSLLPQETVFRLRLDVLYAVGGFKRCLDSEDGYEFRYPQEWLADQAIALAETRERTATLGPDPLQELSMRPLRISPATPRPRRPGQGVRPDVAFGPAGGGKEENVSVVKSRVQPGFSLQGTLGQPREAAETLISTALAPAGSGRQATLINAVSRVTQSGGLVYEFELVVQPPRGPALHNLCVVAARPSEDELFTLTVLTPEERWPQRERQLREVARSFQLIPRS